MFKFLVSMQRKSPLILTSFLLLIFVCCGITKAQAQTIEVNSPADYEAGRQLLKEIQQQAATRKPVLDRPYVFVRSQTKYSGRLYQDFYSWFDRPLFASRLLWDSGASDYKEASFQKTFELYKSYGLDGFATFAWPGEYQRTMKVLFDTAARMKLDPQNFHLMLAESTAPAYLNIDQNTLDLIDNNPYYFQVGGKSVITSYVMDQMTPEQIQEAIQPLREKSGDKILFLPMIHFIHLKDGDGKPIYIGDVDEMYRMHHGAIPASLLRQMIAYLQSYAQISDGLYIGPIEMNLDRSTDKEFSSQVLYPLFKSVLAEPQYNGKKLLAAQAVVGYYNFVGTQHHSRDGTKTLRTSFDLAEQFHPDLLIGTEWDEENEDTGFQPQVAKPMSSQRIVKYYMSRFRHETPSPNPGDDLSLPNIIISQRRQISPGETMDVELLNVPDTVKSEPYSVTLELLDENGKVLFQAQPQSFNTAQMKDHTFYLPSEKFKDSQALRSRLTISYHGKKRVMSDGLPFTVLRATMAWDQTYFCTPLRNVLQPSQSDTQFTLMQKNISPGVSKVNVATNIDSPEKIATAEVVQDSRVIFAYQPHDEYLQQDADRRLFKLTWMYVHNPPRIHISFKANLENAPSALTFMQPPGTSPNTITSNLKATASKAFTDSPYGWKENQFYGPADWWDHSRLISMKQEDIANAVLEINGTRTDGADKDQKFNWQIQLKDLGNYGVISHVFEDGLMFSLETQYRPTKMPLPIDATSLNFNRSIIADDPNGVLAVRLVTEDGKIYWSKPFDVNSKPTTKMVPIDVYSSNAKKGIKIDMPADRVPDIKYDFTPRWGNILHTSAGREYYGHAGGFLSTSTAFTGAESSASSLPFYLYTNKIFKGADRPAPQWVQTEDGQWALSFDGDHGNFLALPESVIPQRAGFTLSFEIKPEEVKPEQVLFANEAYSFGTFNLSVKDGKFQFYFTRRTPDHPELNAYSQKYFQTNIPLYPGKWQNVLFSYDESKLTLSANGQTESFPFEGIGLYLQSSVFGGQGDKTKDGVIPFFHGLLRSLEVKHYVEQ
jgi:hypothetical protein